VRAAEPCQLYRVAAEPFLEAIRGGQASTSLVGMVDVRLFRSHPRLAVQPVPGPR